MPEERRNTLIGGGVMLALLGIMALVYIGSAREKADDGYDLIARFHKAEGVRVGTEVWLSGEAVGKVSGQVLDKQFRAVLTLRMKPWVKVPVDSDVRIEAESLLGSNFIALHPGGDEKDMQPNAEFTLTGDSLAINDILEMVIAQAESAHGIKAEGGTAHQP